MTKPTLPVSQVVNVKVEMSPKAAALRNFGATLILGTSETIDTDTRIVSYSASELGDIASAFGSSSPEYQAAVAFFSQSPKPQEVQIGRWANKATSGLLKGAILAVNQQEIAPFNAITAGAFDVEIDGSKVSVKNVNLSAESNLNGVASKITEGLNGKGKCVFDGQRFSIIASSTGIESKVANATATELSTLMGLDKGTTKVSGVAAESLLDAVNKLLDFPTWYALYVAVDCKEEDALAVASTIEAAEPSRIVAFTLTDTAELDGTQDNSLGAKLAGAALNRTLTAYSSTNRHAAVSIFGRMSTINFAGSNTTITLKFKQCPTITAENLRTSQAASLKKKNVNVFVNYDNDTAILQEGAMSGGWYIDERHGLDWLQNYVQTAVWNLLFSAKKVGQDESGSTDLVATISKALDQGVANGLISAGVWNSDGFGALERGDTLSTGYYVYISPMDEQSVADREARKAPPIQCAIKLKGAIHFVDVTLTVNR
ncbi:MAG: DUF3383 domain-containing protein [Sutterella sp.]|jgi:hypothetical protein|uniref:Tail sheath protein n=1 Tax=Myoviridae sp. ctakU3 TaxID=2825135 RepID=A0A8S5P0U7_9CAUD|nr:MAG TPA: tail sheath protein [Myoviridae sp. ctakU3]